MKKLFAFLLLTVLPLMASAQVKRTIDVVTAGTLSTLISDGEKYSIDELTLTGELNGSDLRLVREMVGCDYLGCQTSGKVTKLDLSGVRIVAGGEKYLDTKEISNSRGERTTNSNGFVFSSGNDVLGNYLFAGCDKLEEIKLPNSIKTIGDNVFHFGYGLTSLAIPKNVTSIGHAVIIYCQNLVSLSVEEGNTVFSSPDGSNAVIKGNTLVMGCNTTVIPNTITTIGNSAFFGIGKWGSKMVLPSNVTTIENDAFACSNFTEVEMSEGIKTIGEYAFAWTPITNFQIPVSVTSIGFRVLYGCQNVESIVVKDNNTNYDSRDNSNAIIDKTSNTVIQGCKNTVIPQSVKTIGNSAFEQLYNLESFTIPSWITSIGDRAFADCWNLKEITSMIADPSLVKMGQDVFSNYNQNVKTVLYVPSGTKDAYEAISVWKKDFYEIVEKGLKEKENTTDKEDVDEITIKDIGKTTWCSEYDLDFTNVAGIKAYIAMGYDDNEKTIWLARVMKVPAGTGLLVKGDPGTYKIPHASVRAYYTNLLVGNLGAAISISETDGDKTNYYLSAKDGTFVSVNESANIGKNKAYLQLPTSVFGGTRSIGISYDDEDGTTSLKEMKSGEVKGEEWYTLQGQRVAKPGKGLYIRNGKKVVIK